jgi:hypothetical protein
MARRPNYGQERADRNRKKAARREERLAAKAARSKRANAEKPDGDASPGAADAPTSPDEDDNKAAADARPSMP